MTDGDTGEEAASVLECWLRGAVGVVFIRGPWDLVAWLCCASEPAESSLAKWFVVECGRECVGCV